jgi:methionyl-tRNA formyltransferase
MRTVFMGTPWLAVPALRALHATTTVVGVVCQPDRPAGRGLIMQEPPVKQAAQDLGLQVHQPVKVKTGSLHEWLAERAPDVAVLLAYGRILPPAVLAAPRCGCMNLHASLLPKYRGAAPINWAIVHGETETGMSLMQMDEGLDTGPVYCKRSLGIEPEMTAGQLAEKLAQLAAVMVREDLPRAVAGQLQAVAQDDGAATWAPLIKREHRQIDWSASATRVANLVRGMAPAPTAFTSLRGKLLKVHAVRATGEPRQEAPGTVRVNARRELLVSGGDGVVQLLEAQLEGRKPLAAADLVNGRTLKDGDLLGN